MNRTEEKKLEAISELEEWLKNPLSNEDYTIYGKDKIEDKLKETILPKSILNGFESVNRWYRNNFVYEMLTKGQSNLRVIASANGYHILVLADRFSKIYPNNPPNLLFDKSTYWLANCLFHKWYDESAILVQIVNKGLTSDMLDGGWEIKPSSWFILEIINKGYGINSDFSKFNYPNDMGLYKEALDNWNTNDVNLIDSIFTKLCEFHLDNATYGAEETIPDIQFGDSAWFVYAFEILTWLSIREMNGLENPTTFSHPLMNLELNKLPAKISPMPTDELFIQAIEALKN